MYKSSAFTIFNASAGSGKTFTLVKEYLKRILISNREDAYKNLLAITFTNKAVAEMKGRIVDNLISFSREEVDNSSSEMLLQIAEEIGYTKEQIRSRSKKIIRHLLHHYSNFSVETIDSFNHRLIRTFARDLKLATNFEVSLDAPLLIEEAVDQLISKAGEDSNITKALVDFALEKTDDDKSWDIAKDISKASGILLQENAIPHVTKLKEKSLDDFQSFSGSLKKQKIDVSKQIKSIAEETLQLIEESGLEHTDFSGSFFPKYLLKLSRLDFNIKYNTAWQNNMGEKPMYPSRVPKDSPQSAETIDTLCSKFIELFESSKQLVFQNQFIAAILQNLTPLSVINLVNHEFDIIKEENNLLPISEFNTLINSEIKEQPVPYIYERLGEKYRHYFIDEFQDTSQLQWENLVPLIENSLSQSDEGQYGSLMLVGDAKQSIYRWRGGLPEQFIKLYNGESPFNTASLNNNLDTNWRSHQEIVDFNNRFFSFSAGHFGNTEHQHLYQIGNHQAFNKKEGGYVKIEFIESENKSERDNIYPQLICDTIHDLKSKGFEEKDICILTRNTANGLTIGKFLIENNIPVTSSDSLLLKASIKVLCIISTLDLSLNPKNEEIKVIWLEIIYGLLEIPMDRHSFYSENLKLSLDEISEKLKDYDIHFSFLKLQSLSLYQSCEYIIKSLRINQEADAYLFGFVDFILDFELQIRSDKAAFLEFWESKMDSASLPSSNMSNSVQIMTIHKAKGLEFQVVLFPYADIDIHDAKRDKLWYPLESSNQEFDEVRLNYKEEIKNYSAVGEELFIEHRNTLELDNLNILYVTLTRAVEQLYIFSELPKGDNNAFKSYNHLFTEYLKNIGTWKEDSLIYEFGSSDKKPSKLTKDDTNYVQPSYLSFEPESHELKIVTSSATLWGGEVANAIQTGNLLHDSMANIRYQDDVKVVMDRLESKESISSEEFDYLNKSVTSIVTHPDLSELFKTSEKVINERDIITNDGNILRPDRINIHPDGSASVIDYKTGAPQEEHEWQIQVYADALSDIGYIISEKLLIYISEEGISINKL